MLRFFFFNDTATTEIYTLSLHDALPIYFGREWPRVVANERLLEQILTNLMTNRSEEHTSELQSRLHLVCRLLLEKKKKSHRASRRAHVRCVEHVIGLFTLLNLQ